MNKKNIILVEKGANNMKTEKSSVNKIKKILIAFCGLVMIICFVPFMVWLAFGGGFYFLPNPPSPQIKQGEFPFLLEYEVNGQSYTIEDVVVCEFDGFTVNEATGKYRNWKSYMKNNGDKIILYKDNDIEVFYSPCLESACTGAGYMGDYEVYGEVGDHFFSHPYPNAYYVYDDMKRVGIITSEELYEKYNIKLNKFEHSEPIVNKFK